MLGTEPTLVEEYVETGKLKIVFWPVLNHGQPSVFSAATMACIGEQNVEAAFEAHHAMFEDLRSLYSADRDYYMGQAEAVGVDVDLFAECYDSGRGVEQVLALDAIRLERGIYSQPTFDLNGMIALGAIPIDSFRDAIEQQLAE